MNDFIPYQTFSNLQDASYLIDLLDTNQIPFEIEDSTAQFDIVTKTSNPLDDGIIVKIREIDVAKADEFILENTETDAINDHYLYSFSDDDIMDVIVNQEEWTEEEIALAKEIAKQRGIS